VAKEREIYKAKTEKDEETAKAHAAEDGKTYKPKPPEAIAKMLDGRVNKFFQECCLLEQATIRDSKLTVTQAVKNLGAKLGGNVAATRFNCFLVGIE
jgi:elongation factor Ts